MKKYFTPARIILMLLFLASLCFTAYKAYNIAKNKMENEVPLKYIDIAAPIVVTFGDLTTEDIKGLDIETIMSDTSQVVAVRILNHAGLPELQATKKSPKFDALTQFDDLTIAQSIVEIDKKTHDPDWISNIYQLISVYQSLDSVSTDLSSVTEENILNEKDAKIKYDIVKNVISMCEYLTILDDPITQKHFNVKYEDEFSDILEGISTLGDKEAIDIAINNIGTINAEIATKLAEYTTVSQYVPELPKALNSSIGYNESFFSKLFTSNAGCEIVSPIFAITEDNSVKIISYSDIIFSYKSYDILDYTPNIYLYICGGLFILLILTCIVPSKKKVKIVEEAL